jgi:hypothetical protein
MPFDFQYKRGLFNLYQGVYGNMSTKALDATTMAIGLPLTNINSGEFGGSITQSAATPYVEFKPSVNGMLWFYNTTSAGTTTIASNPWPDKYASGWTNLGAFSATAGIIGQEVPVDVNKWWRITPAAGQTVQYRFIPYG